MKDINYYFNNYVTFEYGAKRNFIEKMKLDYLGLPCLNIVGLSTNLIKQLFDQELCVKFDSMESIVTEKQHTQLMNGSKSLDNYYMW